jgi:hypothetical protein
MKNRLLLLCFVIVSCSSPSEKEVKKDNSDSTKDVNKKKNGWDGVKDGWIEQEMKGSLKLKTLLKSGEAVEQYLIDLKSNDTLFQKSNFIGKKFYRDMKVQLIFNEKSANNDTSKIKEIKFSSTGKIQFYRGPLDFLTKEDTMDLDKSYPDWKEQIKVWEAKHKD